MDFKKMKRDFYSPVYKHRLNSFIEDVREVTHRDLLDEYLRLRLKILEALVRVEARKLDGGDCVVSAGENLVIELLKQFGIKYYSQVLIGSHVCDLYLPEYSYVIEVDGLSHNTPANMKKDFNQLIHFQQLGVNIIALESRSLRKETVRLLNFLVTQDKLSREEQLENNVFLASTSLCLFGEYPLSNAA